MKNYDQSVEINHNPNWPNIPGHPYRILIIGGSGSGKPNLLLKLIKHQRTNVDKFTFMSKIHSSVSINCLLAVEKK